MENCGGTRGSSEGQQRGTRRQKAEGPRGDRDKTVGSWASLSLDWTKVGVAGLEGQHGHLVGRGTVLAPWVPLGGPLGRLISTALNALQGPEAWPSPRSLPGEKYRPLPPDPQPSL